MIATNSVPQNKALLYKQYMLGTHRLVDPNKTWENVGQYMEIAGITRVADITGLDRIGVPVFQAIRPNSKTLSVSQGKGITPSQARIGAVMESLESWHAHEPNYVPETRATLKEMRYSCPYSLSRLRWVPNCVLFDNAPIVWLQATNLHDGRNAWFPKQMIQLDFALPTRFRPFMFYPTTNGLASGNCFEEALVHALCEVLERHLLTVFHETGDRSQNAVNLDTINSDLCIDIIQKVHSAEIAITVFNITGESPIPAFLAEIAAYDVHAICYGSGCHPCKEVALLRALTEAIQSRLTYLAGSRDDIVGAPRDMVWHENVDEVPSSLQGTTSYDDIPSLLNKTFDSDIALLRRVIKNNLNLEAFVIDLTRPDVGLPVCYVVTPGLLEEAYG